MLAVGIVLNVCLIMLPVAARAQQPAMPVVGFLSTASAEECADLVAAFRQGLKESMGSVGDAYDNAMTEGFFASLECELIDGRSFQSKAEAPLALFTYIEGWYNPRRRHSALGRISPINFERTYLEHNSRAATPLPTCWSASGGIPPGSQYRW